MKRIGILVVLMVSAVLAWAVPAHAKGITEATFTGPGLPPGRITVKTDGNGPVGPINQQLMGGPRREHLRRLQARWCPGPELQVGPSV